VSAIVSRFDHTTDVPGTAASAVHARLRTCLQSCPDLRVRAVTEPSPRAVLRHIDIHGPPPRDRLELSAIVFLNAISTNGKESVMKQKWSNSAAFVGFVLTALCASSSFAADVHWKHMVGVITATDNPATQTAENFNSVGNVNAATFAWSTRDGHARVNLDTGAVDFEVHGLVIIGTVFSGTAGPVQTVTGTLVCNPGTQTEAELDTPDVPIDSNGNARFSGMIPGIPASCTSPVFLVRIATIANPQNPNGARGFWIATGTEPATHP
jgi:hypothetical protein